MAAATAIDPREFGRALKRSRKAAGFSNARALLAAVKAEQGSAPSYSSYAQWESGEVTPRDEASYATIKRFHEDERRKTWHPIQPAPDLASAISELTSYLRQRDEVIDRLSDELESLKALVGQLSEGRLSGQGPEVPATPSAQPATGE